MIILGIDTALAACSAALARDGIVLARRFEPLTRGHAERLFPMLNEICAEAELVLREVNRIVVTVGPGSFTGTRVGLAAARGIALAAACPAVGVTTLRAVARGAEGVPERALIAVLFDARRGGLYAQLFDAGGAALTEPFAAPPEDLAGRFTAVADRCRPLFLIGTGAALGMEALAAWPGGAALARGNPLPDASIVARLGGEYARAALPEPLYLRPPDAIPVRPVPGPE